MCSSLHVYNFALAFYIFTAKRRVLVKYSPRGSPSWASESLSRSLLSWTRQSHGIVIVRYIKVETLVHHMWDIIDPFMVIVIEIIVIIGGHGAKCGND